ncbi:MAG: hypothetical protein AB1847_06730 [bacterium]
MSRLLKPLDINDPRTLIEYITEVVGEIQQGAIALDTSLGDDEFGCIDLLAADQDKKAMLFFLNLSGQESEFLRPFKCLLWYRENRKVIQKLYPDAIDFGHPPDLFFISLHYSHSMQKVLSNLGEGRVTLLKYACFQEDGGNIRIYLEKIADSQKDKNRRSDHDRNDNDRNDNDESDNDRSDNGRSDTDAPEKPA